MEILGRRRAIQLGTGLLLAPSAAACSAESSGKYTIHTAPGLTPQEQIEKVRAATKGKGETTFHQISPTSKEIFRPSMAQVVRYGATDLINRIPGLTQYGMNSAELHLLQDHTFRGEQNHQYRAFIVDNQGRILPVRYTTTDRAENILVSDRVDSNYRRNAVIKIQFQTPYEDNALEVAHKGLEVHLETVDSESHNHYAYQSTKVTPIKP